MVSAEPLDAPHTTGNLNVALLYQDVRQEHIYLFQFPAPFPTFLPPPVAPPTPMPVDAPAEPPSSSKHVSFAADVKPSSTPSSARVSAVPEVVPAEKLRIYGCTRTEKSGCYWEMASSWTCVTLSFLMPIEINDFHVSRYQGDRRHAAFVFTPRRPPRGQQAFRRLAEHRHSPHRNGRSQTNG